MLGVDVLFLFGLTPFTDFLFRGHVLAPFWLVVIQEKVDLPGGSWLTGGMEYLGVNGVVLFYL